jgi:hypothetical protein
MNARRLLGSLLLTSAAVLAAHPSATEAREPLVLPMVADSFSAPYDAVWDATLRSFGTVKPFIAEKERGFIESDLFFFYFPFASEASQSIMLSLAITLRRVDAGHTIVQVQPRVYSMVYDGILPGPINNPWADLFARIRDTLGPRS